MQYQKVKLSIKKILIKVMMILSAKIILARMNQ